MSYGAIGGIGLGFSYIVPVTVLVKWFPDRRGLITGIAVGGFGAGALVTAPVATRLIQSVGVLQTFAYLGIAFLIVTVAGGYFMQNPPVGWKPTGWTPRSSQASQRSSRDYTLGEALRTWQWWALWLLLFLNTSAGISVISQESPLFQELARVSAAAAAGMVGLASIGNALGRVFWAWVSDSITRRATFAVMFLGQAVLFWSLPSGNSAAVLTLVTFVILMCYGGGFGTMPAFVADYFGSRNVGPIYGLMLTAWGFASAFGPLLIAYMRQANGMYGGPLHVIRRAGGIDHRNVHEWTLRRHVDIASLACLPNSQRNMHIESVGQHNQEDSFGQCLEVHLHSSGSEGDTHESRTSSSNLHSVFPGHAGSCVCPARPNRL